MNSKLKKSTTGLTEKGQEKLVEVIQRPNSPTKEMVDLMENVSLPKLGEDAADCVVK